MKLLHPDILILGSGFGGSLLALILARAGKSVVMVDRGRHPRFAIGESSTPLADRTLSSMADRYRLPELRAFCHWGSWKREYPQLLCGKKRGFTYFDQTCREDLTPLSFDARRLLVSASVDDEHSDTHWLRSDVDHFLFQAAESAGVITFQQCQYSLNLHNDEWLLTWEADDETEVRSPFLIDATGSASGVLKRLGIPDQSDLLKTNSRSIFAHFEAVVSCERVLRERSVNVDAFPYRCDDAAVHQVLPDGWMWQLRFDDDSLSAGFMIDQRPESSQPPQEFTDSRGEWDWRIARSPFLARQFKTAKIVRPESGLQSTRRIQRLSSQAAGANWAAITNTVGFIDPLHSTGIAHTLFSISRLADLLLSTETTTERHSRLLEYSDTLINEIRCIDEFVEGCYEAIPSFRLWCLWGMLYFAAATSMEQVSNKGVRPVSFLRANDASFRDMLREARQRLGIARRCHEANRTTAEAEFAAWLKSAIAPWNHVRLFDESCHGLYSTTAAPTDSW